jgi:hypothetical protein
MNDDIYIFHICYFILIFKTTFDRKTDRVKILYFFLYTQKCLMNVIDFHAFYFEYSIKKLFKKIEE